MPGAISRLENYGTTTFRLFWKALYMAMKPRTQQEPKQLIGNAVNAIASAHNTVGVCRSVVGGFELQNNVRVIYPFVVFLMNQLIIKCLDTF